MIKMARFVTFPIGMHFILLLLCGMCLAKGQPYGKPFSTKIDDDDGRERRPTKEYRLKQGPLTGFIIHPGDFEELGLVEVFLGVPYASPPTGSFRFMPPGTVIHWKNSRNATSFGPVCPQVLPDIKNNTVAAGRANYIKRILPFLQNESENCLFLNIYVPHDDNPPGKNRPKYPVMIFIHGESFEWGSGNPYDGSVLAAYGKIIVITINYRLGILGFMKPSIDGQTTFNFGLLDQVAVLQWVRDNIAVFNGNSSSITLVGHGTGAACVNFLMVSPVAEALFHRVILMSGSALSDSSLTKMPLHSTLQVAQSLNCDLTGDDLAACLRKKSLSEIMAIRVSSSNFTTPFGPIIDGAVIPNNPESIMSIYKGVFSKYDLLYGCTELESYHLLGPVALTHGMLETEMYALLKQYMQARFEFKPDIALAATMEKYTFGEIDMDRSAAESHRDMILDILSDAEVAAPIVQTANFHSKSNHKSYFYVFTHNSISGEYAALMKSVHGEELPYMFGVPLGAKRNHFRGEYSPNEKLLSEAVISYWSNFAKTGNPNEPKKNSFLSAPRRDWDDFDIEWPQYSPADQSYLHLGIPLYGNRYYRNRFMEFWNNELPQMLKNQTTTPLGYNQGSNKIKPTPQSVNYKVPGILWSPSNGKTYPSPQGINKYGSLNKFSKHPTESNPKQENIYTALRNMERPNRPVTGLMEGPLGKWKYPKGSTPVPPEQIETTTEEASSTKSNGYFVQQSALTINLIVGAGVSFLLINITAFAFLYYKKRRLKTREREIKRMNSCASGDYPEIDDNIYDKEEKDDTANGCSVFKSKKSKSDDFYEPVKSHQYEGTKTPKSDDSGGFGSRFKLRRQMSSSTLDAHTKVRDWIAQEIVQRCSPSFLRKATDGKVEQKVVTNGTVINLPERSNQPNDVTMPKPNCKIGSLTGSLKATTESTMSIGTQEKRSKLQQNKSIDSDAKTSSSRNKSESGKSSKQSTGTKSVKTKNSEKDASDGSLRKNKKPQKVSVAIDATPATRTSSVLRQEPIELTKSLDYYFCDENTKRCSTPLRRSQTVEDIIKRSSQESLNNQKDNVFKSTVNLKLSKPTEPSEVIKIVHQHSKSDPVTDVNYTEMLPLGGCQNKPSSFNTFSAIQPPVAFRNDINVTSRDENIQPLLSPAEALMTIKRRNYPKVLPDLPKPGENMPSLAQKRLSLPPQSHLMFTSLSEDSSADNSNVSSPTELKSFTKDPPLPPPRRSSTLGRNPISPLERMNSLEKNRSLDRNTNYNYIEMTSNTLPHMPYRYPNSNDSPAYYSQMYNRPKNRVNMMDLERNDSFSEQSESELEDSASAGNSLYESIKPQPKIIIAPKLPDSNKIIENKIIIKPTINRNPNTNKHTNIPRVLARENSINIEDKPVQAVPNQFIKSPQNNKYPDAIDAKRMNYGKTPEFKIEIPVYKPDSKGPPTDEELVMSKKNKDKETENKTKGNTLTRQDSNKKTDARLQESTTKSDKKPDNFTRNDSFSKIPKTPTMTTKMQKVHANPKVVNVKNLNKTSPIKIITGIPQLVPAQKVTNELQDLEKSTSDSSNDTECSIDTVKNTK